MLKQQYFFVLLHLFIKEINMTNAPKLFNEFPPVSTEEWEKIILQDLKGGDYEKKLIWKTEDGLKVRPYYRAEDLDNLTYLDTQPAEYPFTRGFKTQDNRWDIVQEITETVPEKANQIARESLDKGATVVALPVDKITEYEHLETLLHNLPLEKCAVNFYHIREPLKLMELFIRFIEKQNFNKEHIHGSLDIDFIANLINKDARSKATEEGRAMLAPLFTLTKQLPHFTLIQVGGNTLHNAGATLVQEVGYALAIANEYLALLTELGISVDTAASKMAVSLSVASNYFMEIAKLRAIRLLWSTIVTQYHPKSQEAFHLRINAVGSIRNKTIYDPYVNILRSTTEGMAASIGGADAISLQPFDKAFKTDDDFSRRISRNIQIILKEEAYFDKVIDPAAGSYYIENLTDSIAAHAWELFKNTEKEGGILHAIESDMLVSELKESRLKREKEISSRKAVLLGTNQYPNNQETMLDKIEFPLQEITENTNSRDAVAFEQVRLASEKFAQLHHRPSVFLLKVGNLTFRQARAGFTTNFFGCAGFDIMDNSGFATIEEGVGAAIASNADIVVMCSSDEEYASLGVAAVQLLKSTKPDLLFVIAGNPVDAVDALKTAGVDDFIHVRTNVLDSLRNFQQKLNIEHI